MGAVEKDRFGGIRQPRPYAGVRHMDGPEQVGWRIDIDAPQQRRVAGLESMRRRGKTTVGVELTGRESRRAARMVK